METFDSKKGRQLSDELVTFLLLFSNDESCILVKFTIQ